MTNLAKKIALREPRFGQRKFCEHFVNNTLLILVVIGLVLFLIARKWRSPLKVLKEAPPLSPTELALVEKIQFDPEILRGTLKPNSETELEQLEGFTESGERKKVNGIVATIHEELVDKLMLVLPPYFLKRGYLLFQSERNFGEKPDKLALIKSSDPYEILRIQSTAGVNYDLATKDIIHRLKEWEKKFSFTLVGAGFDWLQINLETLPADVDGFAQEVYKFCPDIVDQGVQKVEELAKIIREDKVLALWWD